MRVRLAEATRNRRHGAQGTILVWRADAGLAIVAFDAVADGRHIDTVELCRLEPIR